MTIQEVMAIINSAGVVGVLALGYLAERRRANDAWRLIQHDWERQRQRETESDDQID